MRLLKFLVVWNATTCGMFGRDARIRASRELVAQLGPDIRGDHRGAGRRGHARLDLLALRLDGRDDLWHRSVELLESSGALSETRTIRSTVALSSALPALGASPGAASWSIALSMLVALAVLVVDAQEVAVLVGGDDLLVAAVVALVHVVVARVDLLAR